MSIPFNPITITIGKNSLPSFISLHIAQRIGTHHRFQMSVELERRGTCTCTPIFFSDKGDDKGASFIIFF